MTSLTPDIRISDPDMSAALKREIDLQTHPFRMAIADALENGCTLYCYAAPVDNLWSRAVFAVAFAIARVVRPS